MTESNHLALYDSAQAALAKSVRVDEVKKVRDTSIAIKAYARIAKDREMELNAVELRFRAERRIGQMMEEGKADRASQGGNRRSKVSEKLLKPTLKEAGIDGNLAHRARCAAAMSDEEFAGYLERRRYGGGWDQPYPETKEQRAERLAEQREIRSQRREKLEAIQVTNDDEPSYVEDEDVEAEIMPPKRSTQSAALEIISPTFTTKGAVNQTRFAETMRSVKQGLRSAYLLSDHATFFKHARDMLDDLERELVPVSGMTNLGAVMGGHPSRRQRCPLSGGKSGHDTDLW